MVISTSHEVDMSRFGLGWRKGMFVGLVLLLLAMPNNMMPTNMQPFDDSVQENV